MKTTQLIQKLILGSMLALLSLPAMASDVSKDLESLGSNEAIVRRANRIDSRTRVSIVQGRTVPRRWRLELGVNYGPVAAGDSYLRTQNLGGQVDLHITPKFSLGVRYAKAFNSLTDEGRSMYEAAREAYARGGDALANANIPSVDYPEQTVMGVFNWYMLYGKINLFDWTVVQFDIYSLGGYGKVTLSESGPVDTWTAGGGVGFWLSKHASIRTELRYQTYKDQIQEGGRNLNLIVGNVGLGVLL